MPSRTRYYYAAGPGDVVTTFRHWLRGEDDPSQFAVTYSGQFFEVVKSREAGALIVSAAENADRETDGRITAVNRPLPRWSRSGGWLTRQIVSGLRVWADLLRYRPKVAVIAEGTTFWTLLLPLTWAGFKILPAIHCVLHPLGRRRNWPRRAFDRIERRSLGRLTPVCLTASSEIEAQLAPGQRALRFWPTYRRERFDSLPVPDGPDSGPVRLLYVGRIEEDKGIFHLLDAVAELNRDGNREVRLELCGTGRAMERLVGRIAELGLERVVSPMGHCSVDRLRGCLGRCRAVVVPTTSRFVEGFNQVIVEGVLAGRRVIATSVCPAAHLFGEAVTVIRPDSSDEIVTAVLGLAPPPRPTPGLGEEFFSERHSWASRCAMGLDRLERNGGGPFRLYYAAGPGDIVNTFRHWLAGEDDPREFARTYSGQFFDLARDRGAAALAVSYAGTADRAAGLGIEVRNRPLPGWRGRSGYYGRQAVAAARLWADLLRFRPETAIVAEGTTFWTLLLPLRWLGFRILPTMHCLLRQKEERGGRWRRTQEAIERRSLGWLAPECLVVSGEIEAQLAPGQLGRRFFPSYRRDRFSSVPKSSYRGGEFRLLYAGRIEEDKGVFDLVEAMDELRRNSPVPFILDCCGDGDAMGALRDRVEALGLGRRVKIHGHCEAGAMARRIAGAHAVVVPTTSRFLEGFNKVIAEGVFSGRPVVATSVCPSASLFPGAVRLVAPDSPAELAAALRDLAENPGRHEEAAEAARRATGTLDGEGGSWGEQCGRAIGVRRDVPRIGYLVPSFPDLTHAFFWREVTALRAGGAEVRLISTRQPSSSGGGMAHPFSVGARRETFYLNRGIAGAAGWLLGRPLRALGAVAYVMGLSEGGWRDRALCLALLPAAANLCRLCRRESIEHVHIHSCANAAHLGAMARRLDGVAFSLTLHGDLPVYGKDHARKMEGASFVSAVTLPLREQVRAVSGLPSGRVPVITMGVDTERFRPAGDREPNPVPRVVTVARLIPQKGHRDALAAFARLAEEGIDFRYTIAGEGPERQGLEAEVSRLGLSGKVDFAGRLGEDAVRDLLAASDVLLLPSYGLGEAAPVSVMEAMACGVTVVCSRIGGTPDMIRDGVDGYLTPQRDPAAMAETLGDLLADPARRERIGRAARASAEARFDYRATAGELRRAIERSRSRTV
ncbi:MAG: glycosyltransferase [Verrucomicrobiae bacterium]|nr:glycosyltransferase [Verrucomicrobiae bacterium]